MLRINRVPAEAHELQYALDGGVAHSMETRGLASAESLLQLATELAGLSRSAPEPARVAAGRLKLMAALRAEAFDEGAGHAVAAQARVVVVAAAAVLGGGLLVASAARGSDPLTTAWDLVQEVPVRGIGGQPTEVPILRKSVETRAVADVNSAVANDRTAAPAAIETPAPPATRQASGGTDGATQIPARPSAPVQPVIATAAPPQRAEPVATASAEPTREGVAPSSVPAPSETPVPTSATRTVETPVPTATTRAGPPDATRTAAPAETPAPPGRGDEPATRRAREPVDPAAPITGPVTR